MLINCAYDELVPIEQIIESPKNYNLHSQRQIDMLAKMIAYQGQRSPIVVSKRSGFVVCGAGRLNAIKKLGWDKAAVNFQDFESEAMEHAHMVADNAIQDLAETDQIKLEDIQISLGEDFDHELLGMAEPIDIAPIGVDDINTGERKVDFEEDKLKHECPACAYVWSE